MEPLRVACIGMGWWSDVLADAIQRSKKLKIVACFTRSEDKRKVFAAKYGCVPASSYDAILKDRSIEAIINTTPNDAHLETTRAAAEAGKHVFLDKPIANSVSQGRAIAEACRKAKVVLALGYQRRRESHFRWIRERIDAGEFGKLVNAEANISRDRLGKVDLNSWRYTAAGMPGGVMLQIGIHYSDVLEYLLGPVKAVSGRFALDAQRELCVRFRVLPHERIRQGSNCVLRYTFGTQGTQAGREQRDPCVLSEE
jgi:predicted dehydrogenase